MNERKIKLLKDILANGTLVKEALMRDGDEAKKEYILENYLRIVHFQIESIWNATTPESKL